ncbi:MAG: SBBP repeat-containing protein [Bacteroidota bacterium]
MRLLLQCITVTVFVSQFLFGQDVSNKNVLRPNNDFMRSHVHKKLLEQSHNLSPRYQRSISKTFTGVDTAWVRYYGSGLLPASQSTAGIAVDGFGNTYVIGTCENGLNGFDYCTIKFDSSGKELWVRHYNGSENSSDYAASLVVDKAGDVYVTGTSEGLSNDYATIKYNANGEIAWVRRYGGLGNYDDGAAFITGDESGNVYVSGKINGDYATIKYNTNGDTVWVRRYEGPGNSDDSAYLIAVDGSGNVLVGGTSYLSGVYNFILIKYNANGETVWTRSSNTPGNSFDLPASLAFDDSGNVYATAESYCSGLSVDYVTIKYNTNGDTIWARRYNGPGNSNDEPSSLTVDGKRNVYVTGIRAINYAMGEFTTIKYDPNGDTLWMRRYQYYWPNSSFTRAPSLSVDGNGNVCVTGSSLSASNDDEYTIIQYDSAGVKTWVQHSKGSLTSHAVDGDGNVFVTGYIYSTSQFTTIKYNTKGASIWQNLFYGPGLSSDRASSLAVDEVGNVYVTGSSYNASGTSDYATVKYNKNGEIQWAKRYNGPVDSTDDATSIAVDGSGNVYVTGMSTGSGSYADFVTIKYNANGDTVWVRRYNGPDNGIDNAISLAIDGNGYVYVTGSSSGDNATIKYNSIGDTFWIRRYPGIEAKSLAIDGRGNVYVAGNCSETGGYYDYITIKYNENGDTVWVRRYDGPGNSADWMTTLLVDANENVYVTGASGIWPNYDYATIKYNSNGDSLWVRRYNGTGDNYDSPSSLAIDNSGNVYVTGESDGSEPYYSDYATIKYNPNGDTVWVRRYNRPEEHLDAAAKSITVDVHGNVYVTGETDIARGLYGRINGGDCTTIKYNNAGNEEWTTTYFDRIRNTPVGIQVDAIGNIYIAGTKTYSDDWNYQNFYSILKYTQTPTSVKIVSSVIPSKFTLQQNYPNPFNPSTVISYQLPVNSKVTLEIYDVLGREVATLVNEEQSAGWKEVRWNASKVSSGIYFYKIQAGNYVEVKKMLVVK